jgi:thiol-disulfide isomerase/thioredoxin
MQAGQWLLRIGWIGTYAQTQHDDFADVVGQGSIPIIHDQDIAIGEARLSLDAGLTARFGASLVIPLRVVSTSIVYRDGKGNPVELVEPNIHHRDEVLTGLADPLLLGSFTDVALGVRWTARAGVSIPLGRTEEDPFALGDMGLRHEHIQMGTGTFNPVLALEASHGWGAWRFGGFVFTQQTIYENGKGYHAGDRYAAGLSLRRALGRAWSVRGGPEIQAETAERWNGVKHTEEGNQGRFDAMLGAGVTWTARPPLAIDLGVKVPVYTHVVGGQLHVPAIVEIGAAWSFGGSGAAHEHEHEHDHDHEHEHAEHAEHATIDTTGADVADVGAGGQRVDLVSVPGKVTIFDFWAEWCEPCKNLEPVLVEIARAHPDRVALRRVEVIDWDSPVADQYLTPGGFGLPHLKVYDERGALVLEQSSAPGKLGALIESVRRLAEPPATSPPAAPPASPPTASKPRVSKPAAPVVVDIAVTSAGFVPKNVDVPRGRKVVLRFRRTEEKTCATEVVLDHDGTRVIRDLPLGRVVELALTFTKPGTIRYSCAMNMIHGTITVK